MSFVKFCVASLNVFQVASVKFCVLSDVFRLILSPPSPRTLTPGPEVFHGVYNLSERTPHIVILYVYIATPCKFQVKG